MLAHLRTNIALQYATAALLVLAFVLVAGLLPFSVSLETCATCIAVACSGVGVALVWFKWRWQSEPSTPSIRRSRDKVE